MKRKELKRVIIMLIALILMFVCILFDFQILAIIGSIKNPVLDSIFSVLLFIQKEPYFEIWLFLFMFILFFTQKKKGNFLKFAISFIIAGLISLFFKTVTARSRPISLEKNSFPSGHSSLIFTTFPFIKNKTFQIIWLIFSILLVLTRVYMGLHFLSDIIAGFIIGYGISTLLKESKISQKWKRKKRKAKAG